MDQFLSLIKLFNVVNQSCGSMKKIYGHGQEFDTTFLLTTFLGVMRSKPYHSAYFTLLKFSDQFFMKILDFDVVFLISLPFWYDIKSI